MPSSRPPCSTLFPYTTLFRSPATGVIPFQGRKLAFGMGLPAGAANKLVKVLESIYKAFVETDASMIEINPLILTKGGDLLALDARSEEHTSELQSHSDLVCRLLDLPALHSFPTRRSSDLRPPASFRSRDASSPLAWGCRRARPTNWSRCWSPSTRRSSRPTPR